MAKPQHVIYRKYVGFAVCSGQVLLDSEQDHDPKNDPKWVVPDPHSIVRTLEIRVSDPIWGGSRPSISGYRPSISSIANDGYPKMGSFLPRKWPFSRVLTMFIHARAGIEAWIHGDEPSKMAIFTIFLA